MSIRRIFALAGRIIQQFVRDRRTMALLFLAPLFIMTILNFVLNSSSSGATLAVVPPDGTFGSQLVSQLQQQAKSQGSLTLKTIDRGAVDSTLQNGDADGVLVFPTDFAAQVQQHSTPTLTLRLEGTNPSIARQLTGMVTLLTSNFRSPAAPATTGSGQIPVAVATSYLYAGPEYTQTDALAPLFIGLFSFFFVFLLTSVAFLRERSQGTIERILVSPMRRTEVVTGYMVGFTIFALAQSLIIMLYVIGILRVHYAGNPLILFLVTALLTVGAVNMGIFVSAFARNELQVIQFIPLLLVPQVLLGGLFFPVSTLPVVLKQLAYVMPLTYANFALKDVMLKNFGIGDIGGELLFLTGFAVLMILASAFSLRNEKV